MKHLINLILFTFMSCYFLSAQQPQPVYSVVKEDKPHSFYVEQARLWWEEVEKDRSNEKAWYNYYRANRYARMSFNSCKTPECEQYSKWTDESKYLKDLDIITELIGKEVPNTYTYYILLKDGSHDEERYEALQKAYTLEPDNPDTYDELVVYFETNSMLKKRREFNLKWFNTNEISPGILNFNYNVLMSMRKGAVLISFGDNDTFPIWMLQDALSIRTDITVLNVYLLGIKKYREAQFRKLGIKNLPEESDGTSSTFQEEIIDHILKYKPHNLPLYTSTPAWKRFQSYEDKMYLVGLVLAYSEENIDNIALLKNNFENKYALDYIENVFSYDLGKGVSEKTNVNYLPGIIKLYKHYKLSGHIEKAESMKKLGLTIAANGGEEWKEKAEKIFQ